MFINIIFYNPPELTVDDPSNLDTGTNKLSIKY